MKTFIVVIVIAYCALGVMTTTYPDLVDRYKGNAIKHIGIVMVWPFVLLVAVGLLLRWLARRIIKDLKALLPVRKVLVEAEPKQVTVEMLATAPDPEFKPGQWMIF